MASYESDKFKLSLSDKSFFFIFHQIRLISEWQASQLQVRKGGIHILRHLHGGEGGLQNDDIWWQGEGGLQNGDVINKGSFLEQYPKKITQSFVAISYLLCFYV